ncbi:hypothetical protein H5395_17020 [Paracoccus sp. MC1854]|uniref:hypothetical protein n=1 Tax=Paracoccus sp. MC1854 TaxID=2760306 RepID=UPI001603AD7C|nr:hypothetical protein [Paracoccus sp. MC1854]MBB1493167.1 hypothetical protein [Paracoccus sp. MC1854]
MTRPDSTAPASSLTVTEWKLLLEAIHLYRHNPEYRTLHDKLSLLARASGVRLTRAASRRGASRQTGQDRPGVTG